MNKVSVNPSDKFQEQISEKMLNVFDLVVSSRSSYYAENPSAIPNKQSVKSIRAISF
jgi:hypothetical protein